MACARRDDSGHRTAGDEDLDALAHQFLCEFRQQVDLQIGVSALDDEVPALIPADCAQGDRPGALTPLLGRQAGAWRRVEDEIPDPSHPFTLLAQAIYGPK
ncbi:MAG: hypothetical protein ABI654_00690 [Betaproteobacteria bacterium]